jgi:SAM-dependent methyltransferase
MIEPASHAPTQSVDVCPLCHSPLHTTVRREPPYELRRCAACGLGYVTPRRTADGLAAMYADDLYWHSPSPRTHGYRDYRAEGACRRRAFARRLGRVLEPGPCTGRALDVGCAAGFGMAALSERGYDVRGVEISAPIAAHARDTLGFGDAVFVGALEAAPFAPASFDLICMWDVIERVPDPAALLRGARELLAPDGRLVIETPDADSLLARRLGRRWRHFKPAEQILHFTPSTVRRLLTRAGFAVERLTHRHAGVYVPVAARPGLYVNLRDEMIVVARAADAARPIR